MKLKKIDRYKYPNRFAGRKRKNYILPYPFGEDFISPELDTRTEEGQQAMAEYQKNNSGSNSGWVNEFDWKGLTEGLGKLAEGIGNAVAANTGAANTSTINRGFYIGNGSTSDGSGSNTGTVIAVVAVVLVIIVLMVVLLKKK